MDCQVLEENELKDNSAKEEMHYPAKKKNIGYFKTAREVNHNFWLSK